MLFMHQRGSSVIIRLPIITFKFVREEGSVNERSRHRVLCGKGIEFALHKPRWETYPPAELLKIATTYGTGIRQLHAFAEKSLFERKDTWLVKMETGVDEVVSR